MAHESLGETVFEDVYDALEEARCQIRRGRLLIERAINALHDATIANTEEGQYNGTMARVWVKKENDLSPALETGNAVELLHYGETKWKPYRITGREDCAGLICLHLGYLYE